MAAPRFRLLYELNTAHWLAALEGLVVARGAATPESLAARRDAWDRAAHATPHGEPILLCNDPLHGAG